MDGWFGKYTRYRLSDVIALGGAVRARVDELLEGGVGGQPVLLAADDIDEAVAASRVPHGAHLA